MGETTPEERGAVLFKPWIVKRPCGGCQVLFPLSELDGLVSACIGLADHKRLTEMTWLLTHEPPDDLGGMTQSLRRKWCERRDAVLAAKVEPKGSFMGSYRGMDIREMTPDELRTILADMGGQLQAALVAKGSSHGHPG